MTKKIFAILMGLLFIGACGEEEYEYMADPEGDDIQVTEEPGEPSVVASFDFNFQECRENIEEVYWRCEKGSELFFYNVNRRPSTIDSEGTDTERQRICEFQEKIGSGEYKVLNYAHYEKGYCIKVLNSAIGNKRDEGFNCTQTIENYRNDRTDDPC